MNWKFWTWPKQIRALRCANVIADELLRRREEALAAANKEIERLTQNSKPHSERHLRGLHRANL